MDFFVCASFFITHNNNSNNKILQKNEKRLPIFLNPNAHFNMHMCIHTHTDTMTNRINNKNSHNSLTQSHASTDTLAKHFHKKTLKAVNFTPLLHYSATTACADLTD